MKKHLKGIQAFHNQIWKTFLEQQQKGSCTSLWDTITNACQEDTKTATQKDISWNDIHANDGGIFPKRQTLAARNAPNGQAVSGP